MDQLQGALRDGGGGGFVLAGNRHGREGEFDAVGVERLFDHRKGFASDDELLTRQGRHFHPDLDREVSELLDTLRHFGPLERDTKWRVKLVLGWRTWDIRRFARCLDKYVLGPVGDDAVRGYFCR